MDPTRRRFLQTSTGVPAALAAVSGAQDNSVSVPNPIPAENANPGSNDWQLTRVRLDQRAGFRAPDVEGYCSRQSLYAGEKLDIFVSTKIESEVTIEIFRTGYYGGKGARLMKTMGPFPSKPQPVPELKRGDRHLVECEWKATARLEMPED